MLKIFNKFIESKLSCLPCENKIPKISKWKQFQERIPTSVEVENWAGDVAIVAGKVSGGVVCLDFDIKNGNKYTEWKNILMHSNPDLFYNLVVESTPSGGYHIIYRTDAVIKNVKLAKNKKSKETIETRGEGGYFVCTPSKNYKLLQGLITQLPTITVDDHNYLCQVAKSLNEYLPKTKEVCGDTYNPAGKTAFDDYDSRCNITQLLTSNGWTIANERGKEIRFKRPGKETMGFSASWNYIPNRFYVFTTATIFENEKIYKASAVYTMLEHNGDYNASAKALYAQGYGDKQNIIIKNPIQEASLLKTNNMVERMLKLQREGFKKGLSTGYENLDELYSIIKGQFTVITGYPSGGKSEFIDSILMNLAVYEGWKFAVFTPESYPIEYQFRKLIEKVVGKPMRGEDAMSAKDVEDATLFIQKHFFFIDAVESEVGLDSILLQTEKLVKEKGVDGLLLDPWNEIEILKSKKISDTEFIGESLRKVRKFARKNKIHLWIVAHPTKPRKDKDGNDPIPALYDIQGSSHWRNKADNGITVYRDMETNITTVYTTKIKFRYSGKMGQCYFKFNLKNGRYHSIADPEGEDLT